MNKRDRDNLASLVAEFEWNQTSSTSEAAGFGQSARRIIQTFKLTKDDLSFSRAWAIAGLCEKQDDDDWLDELIDSCAADYTAVVDAIEAAGDFADFDPYAVASQK
jgi:hypothetical protein